MSVTDTLEVRRASTYQFSALGGWAFDDFQQSQTVADASNNLLRQGDL
jgi:hypothetical protein